MTLRINRLLAALTVVAVTCAAAPPGLAEPVAEIHFTAGDISLATRRSAENETAISGLKDILAVLRDGVEMAPVLRVAAVYKDNHAFNRDRWHTLLKRLFDKVPPSWRQPEFRPVEKLPRNRLAIEFAPVEQASATCDWSLSLDLPETADGLWFPAIAGNTLTLREGATLRARPKGSAPHSALFLKGAKGEFNRLTTVEMGVPGTLLLVTSMRAIRTERVEMGVRSRSAEILMTPTNINGPRICALTLKLDKQ